MDLRQYDGKEFNEIFITFKGAMNDAERKEISEYLLTQKCKISEHEPLIWICNSESSTLRLETSIMKNASKIYHYVILNYIYKNNYLKNVITDIRCDSPQCWLSDGEIKSEKESDALDREYLEKSFKHKKC